MADAEIGIEGPEKVSVARSLRHLQSDAEHLLGFGEIAGRVCPLSPVKGLIEFSAHHHPAVSVKSPEGRFLQQALARTVVDAICLPLPFAGALMAWIM